MDASSVHVGACVATDRCVSTLGQAPGEDHGNLCGGDEDAPPRSDHFAVPDKSRGRDMGWKQT